MQDLSQPGLGEGDPVNSKSLTDPNMTVDKPPLFKSWKTWYALVLANLALLIVMFSILTWIFE